MHAPGLKTEFEPGRSCGARIGSLLSRVNNAGRSPQFVVHRSSRGQRGHHVRHRRFGALIVIRSGRSEPVVRRSGLRIDHRDAQSIASVEPAKALINARSVYRVVGDATGGVVSTRERGNLDWLFVAAVVDPVGRPEAEMSDDAQACHQPS